MTHDVLTDTPAPDPHPQHLRRFAAALRELSAARDVDEVLQLAIDLAVELVGVDLADIMFQSPGGVITPVVSEELARTVDEAQIEAGDGPCLTALREHRSVVASDLRSEDRWPAFVTRAVELGVRSVVAYPLYVERPDDEPHFRLGSLNLYGYRPGFTDLSIELGSVFAAHCSTALHAELDHRGLRAALERRDLIGQAKGVLMARHTVTAEEAYEMLRRASNHRNVKLHTLAEQVTYIGDLPES